MKIYRAISYLEKHLLQEKKLMIDNRLSESIHKGGNSFDLSKIKNSAFFYIDFLDAVRFCQIYDEKNTTVAIAEFDIPEYKVKDCLGLGYYSDKYVIGDDLKHYKYYAPELLVPYDVLYNHFGDETDKGIVKINDYILDYHMYFTVRYFKTKKDFKIYDTNSDEYHRAVKHLETIGFLNDYENIIKKIFYELGYDENSYLCPFNKESKIKTSLMLSEILLRFRLLIDNRNIDYEAMVLRKRPNISNRNKPNYD